MSNRKKAKKPSLGLNWNKRRGEKWLSGTLGPNFGLPDDTKLADDAVMVKTQGLMMSIDAPKADKIVYAEKPAVLYEVPGDKSTRCEVGTAYIYEDGTVDFITNDDIPQWAKDRIDATAGEFGYTIGEKLQ